MRRRALIVTLALMLFGIALANAPGSATLTCSAAFPSVTLACFAERVMWSLGPVEVAFGVDARAVTRDWSDSSIAAYTIIAWYAPTWNAWIEVATPRVMPAVGRSDAVRVGFSTRF